MVYVVRIQKIFDFPKFRQRSIMYKSLTITPLCSAQRTRERDENVILYLLAVKIDFHFSKYRLLSVLDTSITQL